MAHDSIGPLARVGQSKVGQVAGAVKHAVTQRVVVPKVARQVYRREVIMGAFFIACGAYGAWGVSTHPPPSHFSSLAANRPLRHHQPPVQKIAYVT